MKYFPLYIALFVLNTSFILPQADVTINIVNLRSDKGAVLVSLFNNDKDFPQDAESAVQKGKALITGKTASITFKNLPKGKYAAAILHDENNNLKMDFNFLGIPKEGYGFSNNAKGFLGPPSFNKAAFDMEGSSKKIVINVVYF